jgi:hypothetical protein
MLLNEQVQARTWSMADDKKVTFHFDTDPDSFLKIQVQIAQYYAYFKSDSIHKLAHFYFSLLQAI